MFIFVDVYRCGKLLLSFGLRKYVWLFMNLVMCIFIFFFIKNDQYLSFFYDVIYKLNVKVRRLKGMIINLRIY